MTKFKLMNHPIHLSTNGDALVEPPIDGVDWFVNYDLRHSSDIDGSRLVTFYNFTESWSMWENHPAGDEVIFCTDGRLTLIQLNGDGLESKWILSKGEFAVNPRGVWHTADIEPMSSASCLFITSGKDTLHRPR